ncbi:MAG: hypothetical protein OEQ47_01920 [Acidimicrobiia bacterium]|nr:hypothetical protein [Acidimicrobiia bacterium]
MNHPLELVVILGTAREGNQSSKVIPGIVDAARDRDWKTTVIETADEGSLPPTARPELKRSGVSWRPPMPS